jgi:hypothetical protein
MKSIYAIAMLTTVLMSWSASAETTVSTTSTSCRRSAYGPEQCTTTTSTGGGGSAASSQKQMSQAEERQYIEEKEARIRKWEAYCKPTGVIDKMGITRLRYAHEGCDLGRNGDDAVAEVR